MECPYCNGELEPGTIRAGRDPMYWYPNGKALIFPTKGRIERRGGFRLGDRDPLAYAEAEAWYCRTCKRLIVFDAK